MKKEDTLLISLSRNHPTPEDERVASGILAEPLNWDYFFLRARIWTVEPLVMRNLRMASPQLTGQDVSERAYERERTLRAETLASTLVGMELLQQLERAGLSAILMKGAAVAAVAYGDPSLRPSGDMDILVRREEMRAAIDFLMANGYEPEFPASETASLVDKQHGLTFRHSRSSVDLHWAPFSRHLRIPFDLEDIWNSSGWISCLDYRVRTFARPHHFVFLCAHGTKHEWFHLRLVSDVAHFAACLDSDDASRVLDIAARTHSLRIVESAMGLAEKVFPDSMSGLTQSLPFTARSGRRVERIYEGCVVGSRWNSDSHIRRKLPELRPLAFWASNRERLRDRVGSFLDVGDFRQSGFNYSMRLRALVSFSGRIIARLASPP